MVSRINENKRLAKEAKNTFKNQKAAREIKHLINQLLSGNKNPEIEIKSLEGKKLKHIFEVQGKEDGRVYFLEIKNKIEILTISDKSNQDLVLNVLEKIND